MLLKLVLENNVHKGKFIFILIKLDCLLQLYIYILGIEITKPIPIGETFTSFDVDSISLKTCDEIKEFPLSLPGNDWTLQVHANTPGRISVIII